MAPAALPSSCRRSPSGSWRRTPTTARCPSCTPPSPTFPVTASQGPVISPTCAAPRSSSTDPPPRRIRISRAACGPLPKGAPASTRRRDHRPCLARSVATSPAFRGRSWTCGSAWTGVRCQTVLEAQRRFADLAIERRAERGLRRVAQLRRERRDPDVAVAQGPLGEEHAPLGEVRQRWRTGHLAEAYGERRARHGGGVGEFLQAPSAVRMVVHEVEGRSQAFVAERREPARRQVAVAHEGAQDFEHQELAVLADREGGARPAAGHLVDDAVYAAAQ